MTSGEYILFVSANSDGSSEVWPTDPEKLARTKDITDYYLKKIGEAWADRDGVKLSKRYKLFSLPKGYIACEQRRVGDHSRYDRVVYGHPKGPFKTFSSFLEHFFYLQDNEDATGCSCILCDKEKEEEARRRRNEAMRIRRQQQRQLSADGGSEEVDDDSNEVAVKPKQEVMDEEVDVESGNDLLAGSRLVGQLAKASGGTDLYNLGIIHGALYYTTAGSEVWLGKAEDTRRQFLADLEAFVEGLDMQTHAKLAIVLRKAVGNLGDVGLEGLEDEGDPECGEAGDEDVGEDS